MGKEGEEGAKDGDSRHRAGEKGNEVLTEVRWHGQGFQQVTGVSKGRDQSRKIIEWFEFEET